MKTLLILIATACIVLVAESAVIEDKECGATTASSSVRESKKNK